MDVVAAVMAGGASIRFGQDKALLEIGGMTLLDRTVATLLTVTPDVCVVGPDWRAEQTAARIVLDEYPGVGPLGGILSALHAYAGSAVLAVAVDMPFLNRSLLSYLCGLSGDADVVLPIVAGRGQQLHAVYGPGCVSFIETQIAGGDYKIDRFFKDVVVRRVGEDELRGQDPSLDSFRNVNTPELFAEALKDLQRGETD